MSTPDMPQDAPQSAPEGKKDENTKPKKDWSFVRPWAAILLALTPLTFWFVSVPLAYPIALLFSGQHGKGKKGGRVFAIIMLVTATGAMHMDKQFVGQFLLSIVFGHAAWKARTDKVWCWIYVIGAVASLAGAPHAAVVGLVAIYGYIRFQSHVLRKTERQQKAQDGNGEPQDSASTPSIITDLRQLAGARWNELVAQYPQLASINNARAWAEGQLAELNRQAEQKRGILAELDRQIEERRRRLDPETGTQQPATATEWPPTPTQSPYGQQQPTPPGPEQS